MSFISVLSNFLRHPILFMRFMKMVKSTQIYMTSLVADYFRDILAPLDSLGKAKAPEEIMAENGYLNRQLFGELMVLLEENGFIKDVGVKGEVFQVTNKGYRYADKILQARE